MRLKPSLAVLLAAGFLLGGCGGDDEDTTATKAATTNATGETGAAGAGLLPEDFAADADAICAAGDKGLADAFAALSGNPPLAQVQAVVQDDIVPNIQGQIDAIRHLGEPEEGAAELTAFLDDAERVLQELEEDPGVILQRDPFAGVNEQGEELGLRECAG